MSKLATHEAAHAVARIVLGGGIEYATINADRPHVKPSYVLPKREERVVTVAGIVAEFAFYPEESRVGHWGGDDLERTASWSKEEEREAIARAKQFVCEYAVVIRKVADELLAAGTVSGERVGEIVWKEEVTDGVPNI